LNRRPTDQSESPAAMTVVQQIKIRRQNRKRQPCGSNETTVVCVCVCVCVCVGPQGWEQSIKLARDKWEGQMKRLWLPRERQRLL